MNEVSVEPASGPQNTLAHAKFRDFLVPLLKGWLREPLLHFVVIGIAVFAVYAYMHRRSRRNRVVAADCCES